MFKTNNFLSKVEVIKIRKLIKLSVDNCIKVADQSLHLQHLGTNFFFNLFFSFFPFLKPTHTVNFSNVMQLDKSANTHHSKKISHCCLEHVFEHQFLTRKENLGNQEHFRQHQSNQTEVTANCDICSGSSNKHAQMDRVWSMWTFEVCHAQTHHQIKPTTRIRECLFSPPSPQGIINKHTPLL